MHKFTAEYTFLKRESVGTTDALIWPIPSCNDDFVGGSEWPDW